MKPEDTKDLVIKAQRKLKEITLDFGGEGRCFLSSLSNHRVGSQFASDDRRQIDDLCQKILNSLETNNEMTLDLAKVKLQDVLYKLNRKVRFHYDRDFRFPDIQ